VSTILVIELVLLLVALVAGAVSLRQRQRRQTRQARVEAAARRAEANNRLEAAENERALAKQQLERADRVDPDTA
jgi:uncharacterized protein HemX